MSVAAEVRWLLRSSSESERQRFLDLVVLMRSSGVQPQPAAVAHAVQSHAQPAQGAAARAPVGGPNCEVCGADNTAVCGNTPACPYRL